MIFFSGFLAKRVRKAFITRVKVKLLIFSKYFISVSLFICDNLRFDLQPLLDIHALSDASAAHPASASQGRGVTGCVKKNFFLFIQPFKILAISLALK